jgi:hypothetical protein
MHDQTTPVEARIPLRDREGKTVAYALVDAADYEWLSQWHWSLDRGGYAKRGESRAGKKRIVYLHRAVLGLEQGDGLEGDHVNGNRLDCRRSNLRVTTPRQNRQNRSKLAGASSRYRGVSWHKPRRKWVAYAKLNGRKHHLGLFADEHEAAAVAAAFRAEHMPFSEEARHPAP